MNIPAQLKYTADHEWVKVEGNTAIVGITDFAQGELGDIVFVDIPTDGEDVSKGDVFGTIEAVKTVSDLFMPIDGKVVEINEAVNDAPELINEDAYDKGWLIKIEIADAGQLAELLDADAYKAQLEA